VWGGSQLNRRPLPRNGQGEAYPSGVFFRRRARGETGGGGGNEGFLAPDPGVRPGRLVNLGVGVTLGFLSADANVRDL
jgi:hypothetical protein